MSRCERPTSYSTTLVYSHLFSFFYFQAWAEVSTLSFSETEIESEADVILQFQGGSHGDPWAFDGSGRVLAHAFLPVGGQCHFDDENWAVPESSHGKFRTALKGENSNAWEA